MNKEKKEHLYTDTKSVGTKKRTLTNFFSLSILQIGNYVLPMITLPIISRIIGPENYGAISYAFAFVGYFVLLINAGFDLYGSRVVVANRDNKVELSKIFSRIITAKAFLLLISTALFAISIFFIPPLQDEKLLCLFTYLLCVGWVINPSWLYHGMQDSKKYAIFSFLSKLLFAIVVILVVQQRDDYIYHPLITSVAHVLVSIYSFYYALKKYGLKFTSVSKAEVKTTLKENKKLSLIWWISNQSLSTNIILAGFFLTSFDLGFYSAALRIIIIFQSIVAMPLNTVLFPYIGEAFMNSHQQGLTRVKKAFPYLFFVSIAMAVGCFLFSNQIITLFYGSEFLDAILLLKVLSVVLFFSTLNSAFGQQVMLNLKKDTVYMKFVVAGFVINVFFLLLLIITNGSVGAAMAWPLAEALLFIAYLIYFKVSGIRIVNYSYYNPSYLLNNFYEMMKFRIKKVNA